MKHLFLFLGLLLSTGTLSAQKETSVRILSDNYDTLRMVITTATLTASETSLNGEPFSTLTIDGCLPSSLIAEPTLPVFSRIIEVPLCKGFSVKVTNAVYDTVDLQLRYPVLPAQPSRSKSDTLWHPTQMTKSIYDANKFYSQREALVEAVGVARDRNLARLQFSPVSYNPVSGKIIICRHATVTVVYRSADKKGTEEMFARYHSPLFNSGANVLNSLYPKSVRTTAPVRYLIVANSMFRGHLDTFIAWKKRKGFLTDIVYTDNPAVGSDTTSIAAYIKSLYTNATATNPAPTYVLLVGDVEQLPAFVGVTNSSHISDLYYATWTSGDNIPDCHYGRFSAQTVSQLTPQVAKTLMYEQYTFADPSFLDHAVMVAGVDGGTAGDYGYTHADPAMDYAVTNYVNGTHDWSQVMYFKNDLSIIPACTSNVTLGSSASSNSATVRSYYNQGAGLINYSAHGSSTSWGTPNFTTTHISQMTNSQKFGLMIGNCCQTNKFQESTCFGEALLRKDNYCGAVGYIGGSNNTYWFEDFYWAVGVRNAISATMLMDYKPTALGVYDRTFHTHGESYANWCTTQGSMLMQGNMTVQASTASDNRKLYYWEIYHLMGDPSLMPYMTQADTMTLSLVASVPCGTTTYPVVAAPHAYVALTDTLTGALVASAFADTSGNTTLLLPATLAAGTYRLAASAQQYRTAFRLINVVQPTGAYAVVTSIASAPLNAGDTVPLTLHFENPGNATAHNIVAVLTSDNPMLSFSTDTVLVDSLAAGTSADITGAVSARVSILAIDNDAANVNIHTSWSGNTAGSESIVRLHLFTPVITLAFSNPEPSLLPGTTTTLTATLHNSGHAPTPISRLTFVSPTPLLTATVGDTSAFSLAPETSATALITLQADSLLPLDIYLPLAYSFDNLHDTLSVFIGQGYVEGFESGSILLPGLANNGPHPWVIIDSQAYEGTYCMRSAPNLGNYDTSEMVLTLNVATAGQISFYYSVSSEANYDKFFFIVDGSNVVTASGDEDWTLVTHPLSAGNHTLTFRYKKDVNINRGSDCAWVDKIVLPHQLHSVSFVYREACMGDALVIDGQPVATDHPGSGSSIVTAPNGDVTFCNYDIHPSYNISDVIEGCDSLLWQGQIYTSTIYTLDTLSSLQGCDSIVGLSLIVGHSSVGDTFVVATQATTYEWYGTVYNTSGTYHQIFENSEGCDSTITLILTFGDDQGIDDVNDGQWTVGLYPNPTTGQLHLSQQVDDVRVYDLSGRELLRQNNVQSLDLTPLPAGTYLLRLTRPDTSTTRRVVKQ